jgi:peroxiredoxin
MSKGLYTLGFTLLFVALSAGNILLIRQNLQMRRALGQYRPVGLETGESVPPFTAESLDGGAVNISYTGSGSKRVLLFFTPTCPYCRQQFVYWRELLERVDGDRFEVLGVVDQAEDKNRLREYLRAMGCAAEDGKRLRVALVPSEVRQSYKLAATPITMIIGNDGKVEKVWSGRWDAHELMAANTIFGFNFSLH